MKKFLSIFLGMLMISSVALANGTEDPLLPTNMAILKTSTGARVFYKTEKPSSVKIRIYSQNKKEIFSEEVKSKSSFSKNYNLSNLPQGDYVLVMEDDNGKREVKFSTVNNVEVLSSIIHARDLKKCVVTLFSKNEASVKVTVTDKDKNILASDVYSVNGQSSKLFNLENVNGPVYVEVTDKNGVIQSSTIE